MKYLFFIIIISIFIYIFYRVFIKNKSNFSNSEDDVSDRLKEDAKRFARLLIAEIKLYSEYKIQKIASGGNYREVLKDEIEEAKVKYRKRRFGKDYDRIFDETLDEIFCQNGKKNTNLKNSEKENEFSDG